MWLLLLVWYLTSKEKNRQAKRLKKKGGRTVTEGIDEYFPYLRKRN